MQPPYITTRQMTADKAAERWRHQYHNGKLGWRTTSMGAQPHEVYKALVALGEHPIPDKVDETIGNGSWTRLTCNQCDKDVETVITVGAEPDYESHTASLCLECIEKVHSMALTIGK